MWHGSHTCEALKSSAVSWTYAIKAGHGRVKLYRICVVCVWLGSVSGPCCLRLSGICLAGVASLLVGVTAQITVVYLAVMFAPRLSPLPGSSTCNSLGNALSTLLTLQMPSCTFCMQQHSVNLVLNRLPECTEYTVTRTDQIHREVCSSHCRVGGDWVPGDTCNRVAATHCK